MKISPLQMWYPNWPGHNSIYYNRISDGAVRGIVNLGNLNSNRINSGALTRWVEPVATPAVVLHIKKVPQ
jgi:hypothetical protein